MAVSQGKGKDMALEKERECRGSLVFFYAGKLWSGQLAAGGGERPRKPKMEAGGLVWVSFWQRGSERRFG